MPVDNAKALTDRAYPTALANSGFGLMGSSLRQAVNMSRASCIELRENFEMGKNDSEKPCTPPPIAARILRSADSQGLRSIRAIALAAGLKPSTLYPKFETDENWTIDELVAIGRVVDKDPLWLAYGTPWTDEDRIAIQESLMGVVAVMLESGGIMAGQMPLAVEVALDIAADRLDGQEVTDDAVRRRWNTALRLGGDRK